MTPTTQQGADPRGDVRAGLCWMVLGAVIFALSWRMDRLADQDINQVTAPGLVPGLLGLAMVLLAGVMLSRGLRAGGLRAGAAEGPAALDWRRLGLVLALCVGFAGGLLGRAPFAPAAAAFVAASIVALRWRERGWRLLAKAGVIGVGAGWGVYLLFERLFLVRLP